MLPLRSSPRSSPRSPDAAAAAPVQRFTLVIGANSGGADRPLLQYAVSDAERFARVLVDLGGVAPGQRDRAEAAAAAGSARRARSAQPARRRRAPRRRRRPGGPKCSSYYSGHADEQGLLIGDDRYSYRTLRDRLDQIPADVRIAILDACASGAFTRLKGGRARPAFLVDESADMRGHAFLTSSAETEVGAGIGSDPRVVLHPLPDLRLPRRRRSLRRRQGHAQRGLSVRVQRDARAARWTPRAARSIRPTTSTSRAPATS